MEQLTSPLWPSSTFWQEPPAMSQTTASSSPEVVMACAPVAEIAPSVNQPPWPVCTKTHLITAAFRGVTHYDCHEKRRLAPTTAHNRTSMWQNWQPGTGTTTFLTPSSDMASRPDEWHLSP